MLCPSCGQRKARRACPALGTSICPVCCGTKRVVEIKCPSDCGYLTSAREHPAAVVRRRQERDVAQLLPILRQLTERQHQLFFLFHSVIARYTPRGFTRLVDADVAEAVAAVAATLETAARGVIYEHTPQGPPAQGLAAELKKTLAGIKEQGATVFDREAAIVLRAIEEGARGTTMPANGPTGYLDLVARLLQVIRDPPEPPTPPVPSTPLILP
jgi:hypothetical protein